MENRKPVSLKAEDLAQRIVMSVHDIEKHVSSNNYQVTGDVKHTVHDDLISKIEHLSRNRKKKFNKTLIRVEKKKTLKTINLFFNFILKKVMEFDVKVRVEPSQKEVEIQKARKSWKEARAKAEELRLMYRSTKGDFYKNS